MDRVSKRSDQGSKTPRDLLYCRKEVLKVLSENPEKICDVFSSDIDCDRCRDMFFEDVLLCNCCREVAKKCSKLSNVKISPVVCPVLDDAAASRVSRVLGKNVPMFLRNPDPTLNYIIASFVIEDKTRRASPMMAAYCCNGEIISVSHPSTEIAVNATDLDPLRVLTSTMKILSALEECDFYHGSPDASCMKVVNNQITLEASPVSSITYRGTRIFQSYRRSSVFGSMFVDADETSFILTTELLAFSREYGCPLFASAINTVFVITSFLTYPRYFSLLETSFYDIYMRLWEDDTILVEIADLVDQDRHSFEDIEKILVGRRVRIDSCKELYRALI
jgi:hypothetical protein